MYIHSCPACSWVNCVFYSHKWPISEGHGGQGGHGGLKLGDIHFFFFRALQLWLENPNNLVYTQGHPVQLANYVFQSKKSQLNINRKIFVFTTVVSRSLQKCLGVITPTQRPNKCTECQRRLVHFYFTSRSYIKIDKTSYTV